MSDNVEFFSGEFPIVESLCFTCEHRASRVIEPLDYESIGLDLSQFDIEEGEQIRIEQHTCVVLMQDMDYLVTECNKYREILSKANSLLRHDI
jgi:hypothetical protein